MRFLVFVEDEKNGEGKGGKCLEKINIWIVQAKKNGEGNVRNYLEKQIITRSDIFIMQSYGDLADTTC